MSTIIRVISDFGDRFRKDPWQSWPIVPVEAYGIVDANIKRLQPEESLRKSIDMAKELASDECGICLIGRTDTGHDIAYLFRAES